MRNKLIATTLAATVASAFAGLALAQDQGQGQMQGPTQRTQAYPHNEKGQQGQIKGEEIKGEGGGHAGGQAQLQGGNAPADQTGKPETRPSEKAPTGQTSKPETGQGMAQTGQGAAQPGQAMKPAERQGAAQAGPGVAQTGQAKPEERQGATQTGPGAAQSGQAMKSEERQGAAQAGQGRAQTAPGQREPAASAAAAQPKEDFTATGKVSVSQANASRISETLMRTGTRENVNIAVNVGATIPATVRVQPLPPEIVSLVPEFRGYDYVVVQDEVVIVEPSTHRVVETIGGGGAVASQQPAGASAGVAAGGGQVTLTQAQQRLLIDSVRQENLTAAQVQDLANGVTVSEDVQLQPVPQAVVAQIPMIERYRVFLADNDRVALVDPSTRTVIDVVQ
jgi:hypothetical protein